MEEVIKIYNIMDWKNWKFWVAIAAVVLVIVGIILYFTVPAFKVVVLEAAAGILLVGIGFAIGYYVGNK